MKEFPQDLSDAVEREFRGHPFLERVRTALREFNGVWVAEYLSQAAKLRFQNGQLIEAVDIVHAFRNGREGDVLEAAERTVRIEALLCRISEYWQQHQ